MNRDTTIARFKNRIAPNVSGCWEWNGFRCPQGYGRFKSFGETLAHRVSFILHKSDLPKDACVLHTCDNPSCVNPDHLFLGDRDLNNKDRAAKGRTVTPNMNLTHCKRGHEFNEENTVVRKTGKRMCRTCYNAKAIEGHHRRKREKIYGK